MRLVEELGLRGENIEIKAERVVPATGKVPIRAAGDGRWPVPGCVTTYQWVDWVPFEDLLWTYNPPSGIIATANQPIVPIGAGPWLGRDFAYGYRGARIYDVLRELPRPITRDDLTALMMRNFPALAGQNTRNMKWKKFLYKQLCETEGIYTCRAPSCEVCVDYAQCFGPED